MFKVFQYSVLAIVYTFYQTQLRTLTTIVMRGSYNTNLNLEIVRMKYLQNI